MTTDTSSPGLDTEMLPPHRRFEAIHPIRSPSTRQATDVRLPALMKGGSIDRDTKMVIGVAKNEAEDRQRQYPWSSFGRPFTKGALWRSLVRGVMRRRSAY